MGEGSRSSDLGAEFHRHERACVKVEPKALVSKFPGDVDDAVAQITL